MERANKVILGEEGGGSGGELCRRPRLDLGNQLAGGGEEATNQLEMVGPPQGMYPRAEARTSEKLTNDENEDG